MISINEQKEYFSIVNQKLQQLVDQLYQGLIDGQIPFEEHKLNDSSSNEVWNKGMHFIKGGNVSVELEDKTLYILEYGDMVHASSAEETSAAGIGFNIKSEAVIHSFSDDKIMQILAQETSLFKLWFSISALSKLQFNQIIGGLTKKEEVANPGFGRFSAGSSIITEGDEADYVYSIVEGTASAMHNGVEVGVIGQDEIFGAIAVLTNQKRTASVVAKTNCTLLMVHKDQFSKLVHSHPKLFLNILSSLAEKIISLNEKVSSLG